MGKTTLSRILAKALNCETGITSVPCGVCRACKEIDAGRFVDYVEMDAASNRGVDEMAALLERAIYAPVDARFKVYMIDEVHMLTNHAFNSMLKTLEEPPAHVKFILATTDPQKIPVTVLSRCLQFNLKQMPAADIVSHLDHVLEAEGIGFEAQALRLLSRAADGSMRDALSLTDQAIAYAAGTVTEEAVRGMLGALDQHYLIRLLDGVMAGDGVGVLAVADEMASRSLSFSIALQDLAQLLNRIGWAQYAPASVLEEWPEAQEIRRLAQGLHAEQIQLLYQIATMGRSELGLAPDEYAGFTMTLLRMLAFRPITSGSAMLHGGSGNVSASPSRNTLSAAPSVPTAPAAKPVAASGAASPRHLAESVASTSAEPASRPRPIQAGSGVLGSGAVAMSEGVIENSVEGTVAGAESNPAPAAVSVRPAVYTREPVSLAMPPVADDVALPVADHAASPVALEPNAPAPRVVPPIPAMPSGRIPVSAPATAPAVSAAPVPVPSVGVSRNSPARAALEALGTIGGANRTTSRAPLARASMPVMARPPAAPAPAAPSSSSMSAPSSAMLGHTRPERTRTADVVVARGNSTVSDSAPDDEAPPWAAAPWDDDGAAAFLDSAQQEKPRAPVAPAATASRASTASPMFAPSPMSAAVVPSSPEPAPLPAGMRLTALGCDEDWPTFAAALDVKGLAQQVALQSELIETSEIDASRGLVRLRIPVAQLASGAHVDKVVAAISERVGRTVELQIEVGPVRVTAAAVDSARKAQALRLAEVAIQDDPFVQALLREFDASIMPGSTQAISGHAAG